MAVFTSANLLLLGLLLFLTKGGDLARAKITL